MKKDNLMRKMTHFKEQCSDALTAYLDSWQELKVSQTPSMKDCNFKSGGLFNMIEVCCNDETVNDFIRIWKQFHPQEEEEPKITSPSDIVSTFYITKSEIKEELERQNLIPENTPEDKIDYDAIGKNVMDALTERFGEQMRYTIQALGEEIYK